METLTKQEIAIQKSYLTKEVVNKVYGGDIMRSKIRTLEKVKRHSAQNTLGEKKGGKMKYLLKVTCIALIGLMLSAVQVSARTIYVAAGNSIQDSLNIALPGDTVLVGPGTFYENITWPAVDGIVLISEYGPGLTGIDGFSTGRVIYFNSPNITNTTRVEGFTITNGYSSYGGAGIRMRYGAEATIENNVIRDNTCSYYGAGIFVRDSDPVIRGNIIENNHVTSTSPDTTHYGAGIFCYNSGALIENNTFSGNRIEDYGNGAGIALRESHTIVRNNWIEKDTVVSLTGVIYMYNSADTITTNVITDNTGTGIFAMNSNLCLIEKNRIEFNRGGLGGGIMLNNSSCQVYKNMIQGNSARKGGGIYCYASNAEIIENSITSNITDDITGGAGGGIFINNCVPLVEENIISRNVAEAGSGGDGLGGGIAMNISTGVTVNRNTIVLNCAKGSLGQGGGIELIGFSSATVGINPTDKNNIYHNFAEFGSNIWSGMTSPSCDAIHNYWGTSDTSKISSTISIENGSWYPVEDLPLPVVKTISDTGFYTFGETEIYFSSLTLGSDSIVAVTVYGDSIPPYCTGGSCIAKFFDLQGNFTFDAYFKFYYTDDEFSASGISLEDSIHAYRYNGVGWNLVPGVVDTAENLVIVNSSEFSVWMLGKDLSVGVEERENAEIMNYELKVYPNPASSVCNITFSLESEQQITITISDIKGNIVNKVFENKKLKAGEHSYEFNISNLPVGIYLFTISSKDGFNAMKFIKTS